MTLPPETPQPPISPGSQTLPNATSHSTMSLQSSTFPVSQTSHTPVTAMGAAVSDTESEDDGGDRFVGELNPESIFLAATSPQSTLSPVDDTVGIWVPREAVSGLRKRAHSSPTSSASSLNSPFSSVLLACIQQQCQQVVLSSTNYNAMHQIYVQEVHPTFPVVDLQALEINACNPTPATHIIRQAICLAASASPRPSQYLSLPSASGVPTLVDSATFASQLISVIRTSVDLGFVKDRLAMVQALTILGLFSHFSLQSGTAAETTARAVSHAQTIGLHLDKPKNQKDRVHLTRLFGCIWALDKMNAAFQGRPALLHEHDFDVKLETLIAEQDGCFRLLLQVCLRLDSVIALYRPESRANTSSPGSYPSFEGLIHGCEATRVSSGLLGELH